MWAGYNARFIRKEMFRKNCSTSDGLNGGSRSCEARSLFCTFVPAPIFCVEPMSTLTSPSRTLAKRASFDFSVVASCIKAISSGGIPLSMSFSFISSYTLNFLPFFFSSAALCGTPRSQKISCVERFSAVFSHILKTLFIQALTFEFSSSGRSGFISLMSNPILRPSFVIFSILSCDGSTCFKRIRFARSLNPSISSF